MLAGWNTRIDRIVALGWAQNPTPAGGWAAKRPVAVNLLDRFSKHQDEFLRFATNFQVPFTNNAAEQAVRPIKIRQKISGCMRTMTGAQAFCALRSYLDTGRKQQRDPLSILRQLHDGRPWLPATGSGGTVTREEVTSWEIEPIHAGLFGSFARGTADSDSDIDVLLLRPAALTDVEEANWLEQLDRLDQRIRVWTGNAAQIIDLTPATFGQMARDADPLVDSWRADDLPVHGERIHDMLRKLRRRRAAQVVLSRVRPPNAVRGEIRLERFLRCHLRVQPPQVESGAGPHASGEAAG